MIANVITKQIGDALKAKDEIRLSTLRMLSSALNYEKIAKQHELNEDEEIVVIRREAKKRTDAINALEAAKDKQSGHTPEELNEKINKENAELTILKEYLPKEMGDEELIKLVETAISQTNASSMKDMGKVIGVVMAKAGGRVAGGRVSELVKAKLS